jgi:hypothetical protein
MASIAVGIRTIYGSMVTRLRSGTAAHGVTSP